MRSLGATLRRARKGRMTAQELGEKLGLTRTTIGKYESDKSTPSVEFILAFSKELNVPFWDLFSVYLENSGDAGRHAFKSLGPFVGMTEETLADYIESSVPVPLYGLSPSEEAGWFRIARASLGSVDAPADLRDAEPFALLAPDPSPLAGSVCICSAERKIAEGGLAFIERRDGLAALRYCDRRTPDQVFTSFWETGDAGLRRAVEELPAADVVKVAPVLWIKTRL